MPIIEAMLLVAPEVIGATEGAAVLGGALAPEALAGLASLGEGAAAAGAGAAGTGVTAAESAMAANAAQGGIGAAQGIQELPVAGRAAPINISTGASGFPMTPAPPPPPPGIVSAPLTPPPPGAAAQAAELGPKALPPQAPASAPIQAGPTPTPNPVEVGTTPRAGAMPQSGGILGGQGPYSMQRATETVSSPLEEGFKKAWGWAKEHPLPAAGLAYTGAKMLGIGSGGGGYEMEHYNGPLKNYKLSPDFQPRFANPADFRRTYAQGGIMEMAEGGLTGSGGIDLHIPLEFGGGGGGGQSTPDFAFGGGNEGANTDFFGGNNPSMSTQSNMNSGSNILDFLQRMNVGNQQNQGVQDNKQENPSPPINVGGSSAQNPGEQNQSQNTFNFAKGGSTNLSDTLDYYTKMIEGEKAPAMRAVDPKIYQDEDRDTRYLDPYSAARVRQAKVNKRTYVSPPVSPSPFQGGQLDFTLPGQKKEAAAADAQEAARGGIMGVSNLGGYAAGGNPRLLKGPGDGMSDNIPATINGKQPARLADGEFVIPADVVSHLGNGSTDAGAKVLHHMMDKVRRDRTGNPKQGRQINPNRYMPR